MTTCWLHSDTFPSGVGASVSTESSSSRTTSRASQQRRDCNLSGILIVTVIMFLIFHSPRFSSIRKYKYKYHFLNLCTRLFKSSFIFIKESPNWLHSLNRDLKSESKPSELQPCIQNQDYCQHHRVLHHTKCCPLHGKVIYFSHANFSKIAPSSSQGFGLHAHLVSLHPSGSSTPSGWCFCHRVVQLSAEISQILPKIKIPAICFIRAGELSTIDYTDLPGKDFWEKVLIG